MTVSGRDWHNSVYVILPIPYGTANVSAHVVLPVLYGSADVSAQ
jgi:hypothetical protein